MKDTEDLRITKTKAALARAFEELAQKKSFDKITVCDICTQALVSRTAFYAHYHDKYELVRYVFSLELETIASDDDKMVFTRFVERALDRLRDNNLFCRQISLDAIDGDTIAVMNELFSTYACEQIHLGLWTPKNLDIPTNVVVSYCSHGLAGIVIWWVRDNFKTDKSEVARMMHALVAGSFRIRE